MAEDVDGTLERMDGTAAASRPAEETLDPDDWGAARAVAHRMVDDLFGYIENVRDRAAWRPIPDEHKRQFAAAPAPVEPHGLERAYDDFVRDVLPYPTGNAHPRYWAWVMGSGTPTGALADMLAAGMNPNVGGSEHMANAVEAQVLDWWKEVLGFPPAASGLLVSGGSAANLTGLAVARNTKLAEMDVDVRARGLTSAPRLRLYGSTEMHSSVRRAVEVLGLGTDAVCSVGVDAEYRVDVAELVRAIAADRAAGLTPFCVVGTAGTTNTGSIDDLNALADLCRREGLWFHIDGAIGAVAALDPPLRPLVAGVARADSLAFDMHKWMHAPYEAGCVLVRDGARHRATFAADAAYLAHGQGARGAAAGELWFSDYGVELSRGFRALKVWMSMKEHGLRKFGRLVRQNVEQARYLARLVDAAPELERLAPVALNIVCFRYTGPAAVAGGGRTDVDALNAMNKELVIRLQEQGVAVPSGTKLGDREAIRASITNHRTRYADLDEFARAVVRLGNQIRSESPSSNK